MNFSVYKIKNKINGVGSPKFKEHSVDKGKHLQCFVKLNSNSDFWNRLRMLTLRVALRPLTMIKICHQSLSRQHMGPMVRDPKVLSFRQHRLDIMILAERTKEAFTYRNTRFRLMMAQKVFRADRARMGL